MSFGSLVNFLQSPKRLRPEPKISVQQKSVYQSILMKDDESNNLSAFNELFVWGKGMSHGKDVIAGGYIRHTLQIGHDSMILGVDSGESHILIRTENDVLTFGDNQYGQLGTDTGPFSSVFNECVKDIACGMHHNIILDKNGNVWTWGRNDKGQLGLGDDYTDTFYNKPIQNEYLKDIAFVECGSNFSFAVDVYGSIFAWGENNSGCLAIQDLDIVNIPQQVHTNLINVVKIKCGMNHTIFLTRNGNNFNVFSCGSGAYGQLGTDSLENSYEPVEIDGLINKHIIDISCGYYHNMAMSDTGFVYVWGRNNYGQLGQFGESYDINTPTKLELPPAISISVGSYHSSVITMEGVWMWGKGSDGQLGDVESRNNAVPRIVEYIDRISVKLFLGSDISFGIRFSGRKNYFIEELIRHERFYLYMMDVVINSFKNPIYLARKKGEITIENKDLDMLFLSIEDIRDLSRELVSDLFISKTEFEFFTSFLNNNILRSMKKYCLNNFNNLSHNYLENVLNMNPIIGSYFQKVRNQLSGITWINDKELDRLMLYPYYQIEIYNYILQRLGESYTEDNIEYNIVRKLVDETGTVFQKLNEENEMALRTSTFLHTYSGLNIFKDHDVRLMYSGKDNVVLKGERSKNEFFIFKKFFLVLKYEKKGKISVSMIPTPHSWITFTKNELEVLSPESVYVFIFRNEKIKEDITRVFTKVLRHHFGGEDDSTLGDYTSRYASFTFSQQNPHLAQARYQGEWKNGKMHGSGVIVYKNGSIYSGSWHEGVIHGEGSYERISESMYVGEWINGHEEGFGTKDYYNKGKYNGTWKRGKRNGFGTFTQEAGDYKKYVGQWKDDKRDGYGLCIYERGYVYLGMWLQNNRTGYGTLFYNTDDVHEGEWLESKYIGEGMISYESQKYLDLIEDSDLTAAEIYFHKLNQSQSPTLYVNNSNDGQKSPTGQLSFLDMYVKGFISLRKNEISIQTSVLAKSKVKKKIQYHFKTKKTPGSKYINFYDLEKYFQFKSENYENWKSSFALIDPENILSVLFDNGYTNSYLMEMRAFLVELLEFCTVRPKLEGFMFCKVVHDTKFFIEMLTGEIEQILIEFVPDYTEQMITDINHFCLSKLKEHIYPFYELNYKNLDKKLKKKIQMLRKLEDESLFQILRIDKDFWLLPNEGVPYEKSIEEIQKFSDALTPSDKVAVLSSVSQLISTEVDNYHSEKTVILSGDELFPLFTYLIIKSNITDLHSECAFIQDYFNDMNTFGMDGLLLKSIEAVLVHIMTFDWMSHFTFTLDTKNT